MPRRHAGSARSCDAAASYRRTGGPGANIAEAARPALADQIESDLVTPVLVLVLGLGHGRLTLRGAVGARAASDGDGEAVPRLLAEGDEALMRPERSLSLRQLDRHHAVDHRGRRLLPCGNRLWLEAHKCSLAAEDADLSARGSACRRWLPAGTPHAGARRPSRGGQRFRPRPVARVRRLVARSHARRERRVGVAEQLPREWPPLGTSVGFRAERAAIPTEGASPP